MKKWIAAVGVFFLLVPLASMAQMLSIAKVENGRVKLYDNNGIYKSSLSVTDAVNASTNDDLVAVVFKDGRVRLYSAIGNFKTNLADVTDAVNVVFSGDNIAVTLKNGKIRIYDTKGVYKKQI